MPIWFKKYLSRLHDDALEELVTYFVTQDRVDLEVLSVVTIEQARRRKEKL